VAADGALNRQAVADIVFNDPEALKALNDIVHPAVGAETTRRLLEQADTDNLVVLDIPLLVESAGQRPVAGVIVVDVDPEVAVRRLVDSRGMQEDDVRARMSRQATREERLARADLVIDNSGTLEELEARITALWPEIEALGQAVDP
jgi:dephospho-CoA kinase